MKVANRQRGSKALRVADAAHVEQEEATTSREPVVLGDRAGGAKGVCKGR